MWVEQSLSKIDTLLSEDHPRILSGIVEKGGVGRLDFLDYSYYLELDDKIRMQRLIKVFVSL